MSADLAILDAEIVGPDGSRRGHIAVSQGVVRDVSPVAGPVPEATRVIDAGGRLAIPGGVDGHCHVAQHTAGWDTRDDFGSTSIAALWGGTTTILDFGIPRDATETPLEAATRKRQLARESRCDVGLHGAVISWDETVPRQLAELRAQGITSVKMYATNRGTTMADADTMLLVMQDVARAGGLVYLHAEHDGMVTNCTAAHAARDQAGVEHLAAMRPEIVEDTSVRELLAMAQYAGVAAYLVHQSTPGAVTALDEARRRGQEVYSETCAHYVTLDDSVYAGDFPECFACCPPMRARASVDRLAQLTVSGLVDTISSDHSLYDLAQKRLHRDDVRRMPHGLPGVELRLPAAWTRLVEQCGMAPEAFVALFATNPARINGLPGKGEIAPGKDADIVLLDPAERRIVRQSDLHMGTDFSPFEGLRFSGWPATVVAGGRVVLDEGRFTDPGPVGRYLVRSAAR